MKTADTLPASSPGTCRGQTNEKSENQKILAFCTPSGANRLSFFEFVFY
nr:MAG TPA: hypothetical protein [Caudoviricetes sp.]